MLMIRFQRIGRTNDPAFRIVVLEKERAAKTGNIVELLGTYNPRSKALTLNEKRVKHWISRGAQPTDSIHNLLINKRIITGKKVNVLSKRTPIRKEENKAEGADVGSAEVVEIPAVETLSATDEASVLPDVASPAI